MTARVLLPREAEEQAKDFLTNMLRVLDHDAALPPHAAFGLVRRVAAHEALYYAAELCLGAIDTHIASKRFCESEFETAAFGKLCAMLEYGIVTKPLLDELVRTYANTKQK